jgi:HAD superfamily hydrolase (TIGR01509 family)
MTLPRQPSAVVFDMDGLLFDTEAIYERAALSAAAELGCEMDSAFFRSTIGSPWPATRQRLVDFYGPTFAVDELRAVAGRIFNELVETELPVKPGVLELLDLLDTLGLPRAIATSSSRATVHRHLEAHAMADRFHHVVAHDDCERHKPDPDPFLKAAGLLGVAPSLCLALEDSHMGVQAASAAGMMTIMIPDLLPATEEIRGLCTHVANDLHAVCLLLETDRQRTGETSSEP